MSSINCFIWYIIFLDNYIAMNKLTKYLIIFGILVLILGQGGLLGAVFGFIVSIFRIPAVIGILIIILALVIHYNNKEKK